MDMKVPTKCGNPPIFGGLFLVYSGIYQLECISVVLCLNAYTYLLRIYVLFDLFVLPAIECGAWNAKLCQRQPRRHLRCPYFPRHLFCLIYIVFLHNQPATAYRCLCACDLGCRTSRYNRTHLALLRHV